MPGEPVGSVSNGRLPDAIWAKARCLRHVLNVAGAHGADLAVPSSMHARRIGLIAPAVLALIMTLAPSAHATPVIIRGIGVRWSPTTVSVSRGTLVKWRGVRKFHDLRAYGRNWSFDVQLPVGVTVQRRFHSTGTFLFRCTYHSTLIGTRCSGMCGRVIVTP